MPNERKSYTVKSAEEVVLSRLAREFFALQRQKARAKKDLKNFRAQLDRNATAKGVAHDPCPLFTSMVRVMGASMNDMRKRFASVRYAPYQSGQTYERILFTFDGEEYVGELKGRNTELVLGFGKGYPIGEEEYDKSIALRVFLDGDYRKA
jgi:hypothetical protein